MLIITEFKKPNNQIIVPIAITEVRVSSLWCLITSLKAIKTKEAVEKRNAKKHKFNVEIF